jgi:hypothetical protein
MSGPKRKASRLRGRLTRLADNRLSNRLLRFFQPLFCEPCFLIERLASVYEDRIESEKGDNEERDRKEGRGDE